jgi:hypothetical protein
MRQHVGETKDSTFLLIHADGRAGTLGLSHTHYTWSGHVCRRPTSIITKQTNETSIDRQMIVLLVQYNITGVDPTTDYSQANSGNRHPYLSPQDKLYTTPNPF